MKQRLRILIADDQPPTRQGLNALLALYPKLELVGQVSGGSQAEQMVAESRPDVMLMDIRMPVMDGLEDTRRIQRRWPEVKAIGLTMYGRHQALAVSARVAAFLIKGCTTGTLLDATLTSNTRMPKVDHGPSLET